MAQNPTINLTGNLVVGPIRDPGQGYRGPPPNPVENLGLDLIDNPECEHPLRTELAEIYMKDKKKFMKSAEEFTKKHSEPR